MELTYKQREKMRGRFLSLLPVPTSPNLMNPSNIDPQHLTKIDCGLTAMIEPATPNGVSCRPKLHRLRMTAGLTAGTVTGSQKFWSEHKEKWDHVHLEVGFKHRKSLLLSCSQP